MYSTQKLSLLALLSVAAVIAVVLAPAIGDNHEKAAHPRKVTPGEQVASDPPSDAIVLFDGKDLSHFMHRNGNDARWTIEDGEVTVKQGTGDIVTREKFGSCQLHIEWRVPDQGKTGQAAGNSGIKFQSRYEVQVLESHTGVTSPKQQAGAIYKQYAPLVNACRPPEQWQTYDIIFHAPVFGDDGKVQKPATMTVLHNGVLIQNHAVLIGVTNANRYSKHGPEEPLLLQDHGNPVSYRNIWIRKLGATQ